MPREVGDQYIQAYLQGGLRLSRRRVLRRAAGLAAATVLASSSVARAQEDTTRVQGRPSSEVSSGRSEFEQLRRRIGPSYAGIPQTTSTDQAALLGVITPSDLHFERHHAGIPNINPADYRLLIHGLVDRPMVFTLDDLKHLPRVAHFYFLECAGNSGAHWLGAPESATILNTHPIYSNSEWIGVPLEILFRMAGVKAEARWFLAESQDGAAMTRSVPLSKAFDDGLVAYGQNGEAVRPEQGYPARLLLPGWEGNINVKWLRRIELGDRPFMTREETAKYTDPIPMEGQARWFTFEWDAKSVITQPSGGMLLPAPGFVEIRGLAWSGIPLSLQRGPSMEDPVGWSGAQCLSRARALRARSAG